MIKQEIFIRRCFDLARLGSGSVSPNPMVGAVIVYEDNIIGEGYHKAYGQAHAEVNAIKSIAKGDLKYLTKSTIFISLEPCCIHSNTPPCTDLIIRNKIPKVVFASIDQTPAVNGKSIEILKSAGCDVSFGILQFKGNQLVRFRNIYATHHRPYIILKWASSKDGFLGRKNEHIWLTNAFSKRLVHKWRTETDAIMIGTNTAEADNPKLTNRLYFGKNPLRIIIDKSLRLSRAINVFDDSIPTWIITEKAIEDNPFKNTKFIEIGFDDNLLEEIMSRLFLAKINSVVIEGGAQLLNSFITKGLWDEARVFVADKRLIYGIKAPQLAKEPVEAFRIDRDQLFIYRNQD